MILNLQRNLLQSLSRHAATSYIKGIRSLARYNVYGFGEWNREHFLKEIKQEVGQVKSLIKEDYQNQLYFKKQGWNYHLDRKYGMVKYHKHTKNYQACVYTQIKPNPPNDPSKAPQIYPEKGRPQAINYAHIVTWIRRQKSQRWMVAEVGVIEGSVMLTTLCFRDGEPQMQWNYNTYPGPDLNSLPMKVMTVVTHLMQQVGLKTEVMQNMVIEASRHADEIDFQWLVGLKQTLE